MSYHISNPEYMYAQKKIDVLGLMEAKDIKRTMAEICILAAMEHPFIVRYFDSFLNGNVLNIITEYAGDTNLSNEIKNQKKKREYFEEQQLLSWLTQLLLGVKHIHDRKILHRDLKLENVIVSPINTLKITDFGLSTALRKTDEMASTMVGTAMYISPELCENKLYNYLTDIWSVGAMFYEIVTLKKAFDAKNMVKLVSLICQSPLPRFDNQTGYPCPPVFHTLLNRMLERNVDLRPSANQLFQTHAELQAKGRELMGKDVFRDEFSHTVLHDDGARNSALKMTMMQTVQFPQGGKGEATLEAPPTGSENPERGALPDLKRLYEGRSATEGGEVDETEIDTLEKLRKPAGSPTGADSKGGGKKNSTNKSKMQALKKDANN